MALRLDRTTSAATTPAPALAVLALLALASAARAQSGNTGRGIDWAAVDSAIGRSGAEQAGGVHRYSFPRGDLRVTVGDVAVRPALALGSWVAFAPTAR